jgi:hypothetical protein
MGLKIYLPRSALALTLALTLPLTQPDKLMTEKMADAYSFANEQTCLHQG